ncbi:MAG: extracellular solute-binding protein [Oscillospiraceae bacterium]|jgi:hypothetical protein|nr:extracellular solute-binding protein [Oscillospiraceae bacterium]
MKKLLALSIVLCFALITQTACKKDESDVPENINYAIKQIEFLPSNQFMSHNIGPVVLHGNQIIVPRIAEWFRFSDKIVGESGDPYMHMGMEFGQVAQTLSIRGPNGEHFTVGKDIFYGEDFFTTLVLQLFIFDRDTNERIYVVLTPLFNYDTIFVDILAINMDSSDNVSILANLVNVNDETTTHFFIFNINSFTKDYHEQVIDQSVFGGNDAMLYKAWFDDNGNVLLFVSNFNTGDFELIIFNHTTSQVQARFASDLRTSITIGNDGSIWRAQSYSTPGEQSTLIDKLDTSSWEWINEVKIDIPFVLGIHTAPVTSNYKWFIHDNTGLYRIKENGEFYKYLSWLDVGADVTQFSEVVIKSNEEVLVLNRKSHPNEINAVVLYSYVLYKSDEVDEREILTIGGVSIYDASLFELVRHFNMSSQTHRAVIVDYAETGEFESAAFRLRADLITGNGPDVIIFNQWNDENDITRSLMRGNYLADLNVFIRDDPFLSREEFFENILDVWTNQADELLLITGAVIPWFFWGPSENLNDFTDFTHEGFLSFLRNAKEQGIPYPAGIGFFSGAVLARMLFADDTFFSYETGEAKFDNDLFIDILDYIRSIPDEQEIRWIEALNTGEAFKPVEYFLRNEQLMTNFFYLIMSVNDFRIFDAAVGGLTPIGDPNSAGNLSIPIAPIRRMGIRYNSENADAAWEFIRSYLLSINTGSFREGIPVLRSKFEDEINTAMLDVEGVKSGGIVGIFGEIIVPVFTKEKADVLRLIMESITHESLPDLNIFYIILEEFSPFMADKRTAEDTARIIQSRVSIYLSELS